MAKVYKLENNEITYNQLIEDGFLPFPPTMVRELVIKNRKSGATNSVINLLNNPVWQKQYLDKDLKKKMRKENIIFKNKKIILNEEFYKWAENWIVCCNLYEDGMLGITFNFERYPFTFYDKKYLDEYCSDIIKKLKKKKLVKIVEEKDTAV